MDRPAWPPGALSPTTPLPMRRLDPRYKASGGQDVFVDLLFQQQHAGTMDDTLALAQLAHGAMQVCGFLWVLVESLRFLWILADSCGFVWILVDSWGYLLIPADSC